jgi:hypothetical protein
MQRRIIRSYTEQNQIIQRDDRKCVQTTEQTDAEESGVNETASENKVETQLSSRPSPSQRTTRGLGGVSNVPNTPQSRSAENETLTVGDSGLVNVDKQTYTARRDLSRAAPVTLPTGTSLVLS